MAVILVVEDEVDLCNLLKTNLEAEGYAVMQAFDGPTALALVEQQIPDLVLLDWMLPGMDGLAVCRQLRQNHLMPIMMLTARSEEIDRVLGLEVGADDYVLKPFSMRELLARVRAMLRRVALDTRLPALPVAGATTPNVASVLPAIVLITRGPLVVNPADHTVTLEGAPIDLTPKEFDMLVLFAAHPGRAFSREFLVEHLWGYTYDGADRTVDSHVVRLRKKLGTLGEKIVTVWGVGYRFVE